MAPRTRDHEPVGVERVEWCVGAGNLTAGGDPINNIDPTGRGLLDGWDLSYPPKEAAQGYARLALIGRG